MFASNSVASKIQHDIEKGNFETFFLAANETKYEFGFRDSLARWFIEQYQIAKNPENWLFFFGKLIQEMDDVIRLDRSSFVQTLLRSINEVSLEKQKTFLNRFHSYLFHLNDEDKDNFLHSMTSSLKIKILFELLPLLEQDKKADLYSELIKLSVIKFNPVLLRKLEQLDPVLVEETRKKINFDSDEAKTFDSLLTMDPDFHDDFNCLIKQFLNGIGCISYTGGLLTLAEMKQRKKIGFHTTIIERTKWIEYLTCLMNATPPLKERFVIQGGHWSCGQIEIRDGIAKLLLIDSLGPNTDSKFNKFAKIFPTNKMYVSYEKRQHSAFGCSMFALDDMRHLLTIEENYLDEKYKDTGLFGYFEDAKQANMKTSKGHVVICSSLPLSFLRTMQSNKLMTEVIPKRSQKEKDLPVNKRGESAEKSADKFFKECGYKTRNLRINHKLGHFTEHNAKFLLTAKKDEREKIQDEFTLKGLKKRL